jgi:hypothetical protein
VPVQSGVLGLGSHRFCCGDTDVARAAFSQPQSSKIEQRRECHNSHILTVTRNGADARPVRRPAARLHRIFQKRIVAYASTPRPTFLFVSLLRAGKKSTCMKRGWHRIGGGRRLWLGKAAQPQKPHGGLPAPAIFDKY